MGPVVREKKEAMKDYGGHTDASGETPTEAPAGPRGTFELQEDNNAVHQIPQMCLSPQVHNASKTQKEK